MNAKQLRNYLLIGFVVFFVAQNPNEAANIVTTVIETITTFLGQLAESFSTFLNDLFN